ncbi:MAG: hypothetical protein ACREQR_09715 [Candidatus Binataceae bacterium]
MAETGELRPMVDPRHFTLDSAQAAHEAVEKDTAAVKIMIEVAE